MLLHHRLSLLRIDDDDFAIMPFGFTFEQRKPLPTSVLPTDTPSLWWLSFTSSLSVLSEGMISSTRSSMCELLSEEMPLHIPQQSLLCTAISMLETWRFSISEHTEMRRDPEIERDR